MKKNVILSLLIVGVAAAVIGYYMWNKKPETAKGKEAAFTLTADSLVQKFVTDETAATKLLQEKIIQVSGTISEVRQDSLCTVVISTTDGTGTITCDLSEKDACNGLANGKSILVKGIFAGFLSDLIGNDVQLNRGVIVE